MRTFIFLTIILTLANAASAQLPLVDMPCRVGGYVMNASGQPIVGATVTYTDQTTRDEYQGLTDAAGWYGNLPYASVPGEPVGAVLGQNFPNPFAAATTVEIRATDKVLGRADELRIYDLRGRCVGSLPATPGTHEVRTVDGGPLAHGTYFYRLGEESRTMVGRPRWVTVRMSAGGSGKAAVPYSVVIAADGYVQQYKFVNLDNGRINYLTFNMQAQAPRQALVVRVFNIRGDAQLTDGSVTLTSDGGHSQTDADEYGNFNFNIPENVTFVNFAVAGFAGHDAPNNVFSVLHPDSVAVRGLLADDEVGMLVAALPDTVCLEIVPEERLNDPLFLESAGLTGVHPLTHRREDVAIKMLTHDAEGNPHDPVTLDLWRSERDIHLAFLDGGALDHVRLIGYTTQEIPAPDWTSLYGLHVLVVDNAQPPCCTHDDLDGDGDVDFATSSIGSGASPGDARHELSAPAVLYDNAGTGTVVNIDDDLYYQDLLHTVMKSRLGRTNIRAQ